MNSAKISEVPAQEGRRVRHCEKQNWNCNEWEKHGCQIFAAGVGCSGGCLAATLHLTSHFIS